MSNKTAVRSSMFIVSYSIVLNYFCFFICVVLFLFCFLILVADVDVNKEDLAHLKCKKNVYNGFVLRRPQLKINLKPFL